MNTLNDVLSAMTKAEADTNLPVPLRLEINKMASYLWDLRQKEIKRLEAETLLKVTGVWDVKDPKPLVYYNSDITIKPFAGLFFYSGMGMGSLYCADGNVRWCNKTEAMKYCANNDMKFAYIDSLCAEVL